MNDAILLDVSSPEHLDVAGFSERGRYSDDARSLLRELERRTELVAGNVFELEGWKAAFDSTVPNEVIIAIVRELMRSVTEYQSKTTESGMSWLGRIPKTEHRLMRSLVMHKAEEAEHGEWARRDFLALGGCEGQLQVPPSTEAFAIAAVWEHLSRTEHPFGYLGAEYLFEYLTARVTQAILPAFAKRGLSTKGLGFIVDHATEDVKHTNLISHHVLDIATRYPWSGEVMLRCFDYFRAVYPIPLWRVAMDRGLATMRLLS